MRSRSSECTINNAHNQYNVLPTVPTLGETTVLQNNVSDITSQLDSNHNPTPCGANQTHHPPDTPGKSHLSPIQRQHRKHLHLTGYPSHRPLPSMLTHWHRQTMHHTYRVRGLVPHTMLCAKHTQLHHVLTTERHHTGCRNTTTHQR